MNGRAISVKPAWSPTTARWRHAGSLHHRSGGVESSDVREGMCAGLMQAPLISASPSRQREQRLNPESQANGALMRVAPIGIAGAVLDEATILAYSDRDCAITHNHPVCRDASRLWALAIAKTVRDGLSGRGL